MQERGFAKTIPAFMPFLVSSATTTLFSPRALYGLTNHALASTIGCFGDGRGAAEPRGERGSRPEAREEALSP